MAVTMFIVSLTLSTSWSEGKRIFFIIFCFILGMVSTAMLFKLPFNASTRTAHLDTILIVSNVAGYSKKKLAGALFFSSNCVLNIGLLQVFFDS